MVTVSNLDNDIGILKYSIYKENFQLFQSFSFKDLNIFSNISNSAGKIQRRGTTQKVHKRDKIMCVQQYVRAYKKRARLMTRSEFDNALHFLEKAILKKVDFMLRQNEFKWQRTHLKMEIMIINNGFSFHLDIGQCVRICLIT